MKKMSAAALAVGLSLVASSVMAAPKQIPAKGAEQIKALRAEKAARTPTQRKIESRLLYSLYKQRNDSRLDAVPNLRIRQAAADGTVDVDVALRAPEAMDAALAGVKRAGGQVLSQFAQYKTLRARLPLARIEVLAAVEGVRAVRFAEKSYTHKINTSEGDVAHRAAEARVKFAVSGAGQKVCVLSDGVDSLAAAQASGDLPPVVDVLPGQAGSGDEGTAMLEIVHDLAPDAALGFATADPTQAQFATNILGLAAAGCTVIVDDIIYFAESPFQDSIVADAVNQVTANGVLYFSSAGNEGNVNDLTSGTWEGDFHAAASTPEALDGLGVAHDFGDGGNSIFIEVSAPAVVMHWTDTFGNSGNDYDVYDMSDDLETVWDCGCNFQEGDGDPFEIFGPAFSGERLVIMKFAGAARMINLIAFRGELDDALATSGATRGHSAARDAFSVAAVDASSGNVFTGADPVEWFSSDGPRRIYFDVNGDLLEGAPVGDVTSTGGLVRQKPDIAAADGVATSAPGFDPFYGTSAAAPHAAAIAALLKQAFPTYTPAQIRSALENSAIDIEAVGHDNDSGAGIVSPYASLTDGGAPVDYSLSIGDVTVAEGNAGTTTATFTVTLANPSTKVVTVKYATADGTAKSAAGDFVKKTATVLTFDPGDTSKTVTVDVNGDTLHELDETFKVKLSSPKNAKIKDGEGLGTITNDDAAPGISVNDASDLEGNSGTHGLAFTVSLSGASSQKITVKYTTTAGSATAGSDYNTKTGTVTFAAGETAKAVSVVIKGDLVQESNETFTVDLSDAVVGSITDSQGLGTIQNDDAAPTLSVGDKSVTEGNTGQKNLTFTVTLSAESLSEVTVDWSTEQAGIGDSFATADVDYVSASGTLTFAPGQTSRTFNVQVKGDTLPEGPEAFNVNLSEPVNATIGDGQGVGTIIDNDAVS